MKSFECQITGKSIRGKLPCIFHETLVRVDGVTERDIKGLLT